MQVSGACFSSALTHEIHISEPLTSGADQPKMYGGGETRTD